MTVDAHNGSGSHELALVMSGGGARAAYQVGFLRCLAKRFPTLDVPIVTGVSAGAINAAYLAAVGGTLEQRVEGLARLWSELDTDDVFDVGPLGLFTRSMYWGLGLISGGRLGAHRKGMVDTSPLRELLGRVLAAEDGRLTGVARNLAAGRLRAVALTTSSYTTGKSVTWVQGREIEGWMRADRRSRSCELGVEHVLGSAALPLFFPAVRIESAWYGDGGMRLTAPLSPAIHLGATHVLAISTRYLAPPGAPPQEDAIVGYPPPAQVAGVLLNSIFLDQFDGDALRLERINRLLAHTPPEERGGLRPIRLLVLRPSQDLGRLANRYEARLPRTFRFLTRGLGTRQTRSNDFLSLVMFQPDYLTALLELGERDAEQHADEIAAFLPERGEPAPQP